MEKLRPYYKKLGKNLDDQTVLNRLTRLATEKYFSKPQNKGKMKYYSLEQKGETARELLVVDGCSGNAKCGVVIPSSAIDSISYPTLRSLSKVNIMFEDEKMRAWTDKGHAKIEIKFKDHPEWKPIFDWMDAN